MTFLREIVVALTFPLALTLVLLLLAFGVHAVFKRKRVAVAIALIAVGWSAFWSLPRNAEWLRESLEDRYAVAPPAEMPKADAIVVLGGGGYTWINRPGVTLDDLKYSRLAQGARLYIAGRAPRVILSGGGEGVRTEARNMARGMRKFGVPDTALLLEERSTDTTTNARYSAQIARRNGVRSVLLVTSAIHMPRASVLFRGAGLDVIEVPVPEPPSVRGDGWADRWLPSPRALWRSGRALKEYAGLMAACFGNKTA
ncbi:putative membrane protein [Lysobacter dokdonensis DS-58]|uniref:Putative membrane protein n=1 Tax=Lysobacter dokdonensis DS-58 TaxID=1300345 RepID=A0A0A2WNH2_9GAMM|nr:YdcF family protein [Lysobacter dokdonensis]KGQ19840.1 putative membrane protein [Lysobacter dokdonensis DS-58]